MSVYLKPDRTTEAVIAGRTLTIKEKIIPDGARAKRDVAAWCRKGEPMKPCKKLGEGNGIPRGVVIHNTNDIVTSSRTDPAEQYTRATWPNCRMSGAVVHFYVWKDQIWQNLALDERGWHAGDASSRRTDKTGNGFVGGNLDCIAIECIGKDPQSEDTAAALAAWLLKRFGLGTENLYTHKFFYPAKNCPEYILPHWDEFEKKVAELLEPGAPGPKDETDLFFPPCSSYKGRSIADALRSVGAENSFAFRKKIALANGINGYRGLASQNTLLLKLLKDGKLKKPA